jgi:hypothetical protein
VTEAAQKRKARHCRRALRKVPDEVIYSSFSSSSARASFRRGLEALTIFFARFCFFVERFGKQAPISLSPSVFAMAMAVV